MVFVLSAGEVPRRTFWPPATVTATDTLMSFALLITSEPSSVPFDEADVRMNMGVSVTIASIIARAPVV